MTATGPALQPTAFHHALLENCEKRFVPLQSFQLQQKWAALIDGPDGHSSVR
jgi:hypothetical protein